MAIGKSFLLFSYAGFILFCAEYSPLRAQSLESSEYKKAYILTNENQAFLGEYKRSADGIYLRDATKGKSFRSEQVEAVVSQEYFERIRNSSARESAWKSLLYFDSSAKYQ